MIQRGQGLRTSPPRKTQVTLSFLRNTDMGAIVSRARFVLPSVKYVDD